MPIRAVTPAAAQFHGSYPAFALGFWKFGLAGVIVLGDECAQRIGQSSEGGPVVADEAFHKLGHL